MARPIANARSRPRMSPSFAPASMNAAMTSVYAVMASCTPWMVVSRSATICEIDTFMTLLSSTITNCAEARTVIGSQAGADVDAPAGGAGGATVSHDLSSGLGRARAMARAGVMHGCAHPARGYEQPLPDTGAAGGAPGRPRRP